jgi:16S rRNA G966 N2-methylase RsmD
MRIIGGKWAGKALTSPGRKVRPTAENLRDEWMTGLAQRTTSPRNLVRRAGYGSSSGGTGTRK